MHLKTFILFPCSLGVVILSYPSAFSSMSCFLNFWSRSSLGFLQEQQPETPSPKWNSVLSLTLFKCSRITSGVLQTPCLYVLVWFCSSHSGCCCLTLPVGPTVTSSYFPTEQPCSFPSQCLQRRFLPTHRRALYLFLSTGLFQVSLLSQENHSCRLVLQVKITDESTDYP